MPREQREEIEAFTGEQALEWVSMQNADSRYGRSTRAGGGLTSLVLAWRKKSLTREDAVRMTRFFTIVVGPETVALAGWQNTGPGRSERRMLGRIARGDLQAEITVGLFWTRIQLVDGANHRSYLGFCNRFASGRAAVVEALRAMPAARAAA